MPGYALLTVGLLGIYWTPFLEEIFNAVGVPAMLVSLVGSLVLGIGLLRRRFRPLLGNRRPAGERPDCRAGAGRLSLGG
jgi:hypothetical protein